MGKARMRTIREALAIVKGIDPETSVTYNFIKEACVNRKVTCVRLNKKYLLNLDELLTFLSMNED